MSIDNRYGFSPEALAATQKYDDDMEEAKRVSRARRKEIEKLKNDIEQLRHRAVSIYSRDGTCPHCGYDWDRD